MWVEIGGRWGLDAGHMGVRCGSGGICYGWSTEIGAICVGARVVGLLIRFKAGTTLVALPEAARDSESAMSCQRLWVSLTGVLPAADRLGPEGVREAGTPQGK